MHRVVEPETFWQAYSEKLNKKENWCAYQGNKSWTEVVINIAKDTCKEFGLRTDSEYYRIDLIGWRGNGKHGDCNWWIDVAFEHENDDTWPDELCKLCYVAADLRVLSSYYPCPRIKDNDNNIEIALYYYLNRLGKDKLFRVPDSKWLFIFGPKLNCLNEPFKAFTVDESLSLIPIIGDETVIPANWKDECQKR